MNPAEYANLDRLDERHWFYRGKREIVSRWIDRLGGPGPDDLLIDAGTGTGYWPASAAARYGCRVMGLDDYEESLAIAGPRLAAVGGSVLRTALDRIDLPDACAAVVTALDVLEHLDDDHGSLRELIRLTRPGGLILITVPALRWLWSDWDVVLHHRRRYQRADFRRLLAQPGVEILRCDYFNSLLLPAIAGVRMLRKIVPARPGAARAEDHVPAGPVNHALNRLLVAPACQPWFHPPAGSSLLGILRKTGG